MEVPSGPVLLAGFAVAHHVDVVLAARPEHDVTAGQQLAAIRALVLASSRGGVES